jgi:hypothetical protein
MKRRDNTMFNTTELLELIELNPDSEDYTDMDIDNISFIDKYIDKSCPVDEAEDYLSDYY